MTPPDAVAAMHALLDVGLELVGGADRWHRTLPAALAWGVTTYDALYVQLAIDLGAEVVTADMRLVAAAAGLSLPVRPLTG